MTSAVGLLGRMLKKRQIERRPPFRMAIRVRLKQADDWKVYGEMDAYDDLEQVAC